MKKKIVFAFATFIFVLVAFTGGLLAGVSATRQEEQTSAATATPVALAGAPIGQPGVHLEASRPAPVIRDASLRTSAWQQIEAVTLCKSLSEDDVIVLVDPANALAETWVLACPTGKQEAYKVEYVPTISGTSFTVTRMAQP
ncbi:MAG: hypothetical protein RBS68_05900 [Anaerolineales bacterium]|jgi:hypothetical protein|nr:hypothetical protein [Anaerolineales bacterium]